MKKYGTRLAFALTSQWDVIYFKKKGGRLIACRRKSGTLKKSSLESVISHVVEPLQKAEKTITFLTLSYAHSRQNSKSKFMPLHHFRHLHENLCWCRKVDTGAWW